MRKTPLLLALAAIGCTGSAFATNGYFSHGYGMKAKGMGGAATAMAVDTFGGANNPASMVWVGNRMDLGVDLFSPQRTARRFDSPIVGPTFAPGSQDSEDDYFLIPEFGYNRMLNASTAVGVTVYGNGGMNTDYPTGTFDCSMVAPGGPYPAGTVMANAICGMGDAGVDLMQLIIAPTLSYKVNEQHSIGFSPLFAYQRFAAEGLHAFAGMTPSGTTNNLTNQNYDSSTGWGVRVGWMGKINDKLTLGAAYASKMDMGKFDKYRELFAEQGDFDIPSNWNVGAAFQVTPQIKVALDYQRINYEDVKSIANPTTGLGGPFGADNGPGFGWDDINVWKLGVEYAHNKQLTFRAGYNHGDNPIKSEDVGFNILAPGVVQDHLTLGMTYLTASGSELTVSYMHAFENDVCGPCGGVTSAFGGGENIKMYQDALGVAYSWKM